MVLGRCNRFVSRAQVFPFSSLLFSSLLFSFTHQHRHDEGCGLWTKNTRSPNTSLERKILVQDSIFFLFCPFEKNTRSFSFLSFFVFSSFLVSSKSLSLSSGYPILPKLWPFSWPYQTYKFDFKKGFDFFFRFLTKTLPSRAFRVCVWGARVSFLLYHGMRKKREM